jgi:hypothetical protein
MRNLMVRGGLYRRINHYKKTRVRIYCMEHKPIITTPSFSRLAQLQFQKIKCEWNLMNNCQQ